MVLMNLGSTETVIAKASKASTTKSPLPYTRIASIDMLRGVAMIIMALDHTREFFSSARFSPEDLHHTSEPMFITRLVTHFCAPIFFLLAGTGAYLSFSTSRSKSKMSLFLLTRGLWLVFLELTVLRFGWNFTFSSPSLLQVMWALGWSMFFMALLVWLPAPLLGALATVGIACHNLLDRVTALPGSPFSELLVFLHAPGFLTFGSTHLMLGYPLIPWVCVMALGYAFAPILMKENRGMRLTLIGATLTAAFFIIRGINHYGNAYDGMSSFFPATVGTWTVQKSAAFTVMAFLNTLKYPPSLDYILMTLGPALMLLACLEHLRPGTLLGRVLLVYGRVPLFYYLVHVYLIHVLAILTGLAFHQPIIWLWKSTMLVTTPPPGYGHGLPFIYLTWLTVVALLYFPCRWFMRFKAQHKEWKWLSYI
jgi:uncharacterized membrane protein